MGFPFPPAFEQRMKSDLQHEWPAFSAAHEKGSSTSVRINPRKLHDLPGNPIPWTQYGAYLPSRPVFTLDPLFHAGAYYVQEASSMFVEQAILQTSHDTHPIRVLDLCAAPGGKSTHIVSLLHSESVLVSNEVIRSRVPVLTENIQKWGFPNVVVTSNDAEDFQHLPECFDLIVVDAPCSGEGLFRKDTEAMREWSEQNVALCSARQKRILEDVWPCLKDDGLLIYSTCTYNADENEKNLLWLNENFTAESVPLRIDPAWGIEEIKTNGITGYQFYPHKANGEGFFLSVIRKKGDQYIERIPSSKKHFTAPSKLVSEQIHNWLKNETPALTFIQRNDLIQALPSQHKKFIELLTERLHVAYAGVYVANEKHNKLVPAHQLAISIAIDASKFNPIELSLRDARLYLKKEPIQIASGAAGFTLATYQDIPLGWMNVLPGRMNNLYPSEWRIRMNLD